MIADTGHGERLVSVYLPTRNRSERLRLSIDSVIAQTYENFELLIVDDASEDRTQELLASYLADKRITYHRFDVCRGAPAARNFALSKANGLFVTGIDDDDVWLPDRIQTMIGRLSTGIGFVAASDIMEIGDNKRYITRRPAVICFDDLLRRNVVGNQVLARKKDVLACQGFDEQLSASQDYDLWIRLAEVAGPGIGIKTPLQIIHAQTSRKRISTASSRLRGLRRVYRKHRHKMSRRQRKSHIFNLIRTSNRQMSWRVFLALFTYQDRYRIMAHFLRTRLPVMDSIIEAVAIYRDGKEIERALHHSASPRSPS